MDSSAARLRQDVFKVNLPRRSLHHLASLQDDGIPYTQVPRPLSEAWLNGYFPDAKFRLLFCFLSHAENFHVRRTYLEARFGKHTLKKYLPELVAEGFLVKEIFLAEDGNRYAIYHTNPIDMWQLPGGQPRVRATEHRAIEHRALEHPHNETNLNDPDLKETNPTSSRTRERDSGTLTGSESRIEKKAEPAKKEDPKPLRPTIGPEAYREPIAKMCREAKEGDLVIQPNDLARSIGLAVSNLGEPFTAIVEAWPLILVYLLEKRTHTPASQVYKWIEVEQRRRKNAAMIDRSVVDQTQRAGRKDVKKEAPKKERPPSDEPPAGTPEYIAYKLAKLERFRSKPIL